MLRFVRCFLYALSIAFPTRSQVFPSGALVWKIVLTTAGRPRQHLAVFFFGGQSCYTNTMQLQALFLETPKQFYLLNN